MLFTALGIAIAETVADGVSDSNILAYLVTQTIGVPVVAVLVLSSFCLAMSSTIDSLCLAVGQAMTWDILFAAPVRDAISGKPSPRDFDAKVIAWARLFILLAGLLGSVSVSFLVFSLDVPIFNIVYFVVIAQMTLVPPILYCLTFPEARLNGGWLPLLAGLVGGFGVAAYGLATESADAFNLSSVVALLISSLITISLPATKGQKVPQR